MTGEFTLEEVRNRVEKEVNSNKKEGQANKRIDTRHIVEFLCRKTVDEQYTFTHVGERAEDADEDTDTGSDTPDESSGSSSSTTTAANLEQHDAQYLRRQLESALARARPFFDSPRESGVVLVPILENH